jgi:hypothetical protein
MDPQWDGGHTHRTFRYEGYEAKMSGLVHSRVVPPEVAHGALQRSPLAAVQPAYGAVLLDRKGNLLGASVASGLSGEVEVPLGMNLRRHDLRCYFAVDRPPCSGRRFSLVSATWIQVRGRRVRVGIYMEAGESSVSCEGLELDAGPIVAILSNQLVG